MILQTFLIGVEVMLKILRQTVRIRFFTLGLKDTILGKDLRAPVSERL